MKRVAVVAFVGLLIVCGSVYGQDARRPAADALLGGIVQEGDIGLVFDYLREVVAAASEGREALPPAELGQRAEAIGEEMKRRGAAAARALIDAVESSVREAPRSPSPLDGRPYQRI